MPALDAINLTILLVALLILVGVASSLVATRFGAPLLVVFIAIGMIAGEDGPGGIRFDDFQATVLVGSIALAIILFDGGLRTRAAGFRGVIWPALLLATVGVLATAALIGAAAMLIIGKPPLESLLLGALLASTDAAAVFFVLGAGGIVLTRRVAQTLELESAVNDPAAVFLTLILVELVARGGEVQASDLGMLALHVTVGAGLGIAGGLAASQILNRVEMPQGLHPLFVVTAAVSIYAATSLVHGSGLLAVYLAGLVLGNRPMRAYSSVLAFHDAMTWLAQIVMFVLLGLLVTPHLLVERLPTAFAMAAGLMFVARPLAVALCLRPFGLNPFGWTWRETGFVGWLGLRGAVGIFLATLPVLAQLPDARFYFDVAFVAVSLSLLVQAWTVGPIARLFGQVVPGRVEASHRVELDLPGQIDLEMVGYPIGRESPLLKGVTPPAWARPMLVVRASRVMTPAEAGALEPDDWTYWLAPPQRARDLDRFFRTPRVTAAEIERFYGAFVLNGDVRLGALAVIYDLPVPEGRAEVTIADAFHDAYGRPPVPGDMLNLGALEMVARDIEEDRLKAVGLRLVETAPRHSSWWERVVRRVLTGR
jgi:cell volume regulation protein A